MKKEDRLAPPHKAKKKLDIDYCAYHMAAGILVILMIMSCSLAGNSDMNPGQTAILYKSDMKDEVHGHGYIMEYKKINTNNLSLLEYSHGSGSMNYSDVANSQQITDASGMYTYYVLDYYTNKWKSYPSNGDSYICYNKEYDNEHSPVIFAYGTGWYTSHPVAYNSLLKDKTEAKSYQEGISMDRQVEYAHGLKGDIAVNINCTGPTALLPGVGSLKMKIADNMSQGTMHVG